jgi:tRNA uridine 5-carbamoylmethylation protein Kti12
MEAALKSELRKEINRIVDMMIQMDSMRESIAELKKDIKTNYDIPVATITKVATILRKQNLTEEEEKWATIREFVDICS